MAPQQYLHYGERYAKYGEAFATSNGLITNADDVLGDVVGALKGQGMWEKTLWVMSGDNGGPVYWTDLGPSYAHGGSANNYPLKGVRRGRQIFSERVSHAGVNLNLDPEPTLTACLLE